MRSPVLRRPGKGDTAGYCSASGGSVGRARRTIGGMVVARANGYTPFSRSIR